MCVIKEWDMTESLEEIKILAMKVQESAFHKYKEEIFKAWKLTYLLLDFVEEQGMLTLQEKLENLKKSNVPLIDILTNVILLLVDGEKLNIIIEIMINDFYTRKLQNQEIYFAYIYMICIKEIKQDSYNLLLDFPKRKFANKWVQNHFFLVPEKYQRELLEYIEKRV